MITIRPAVPADSPLLCAAEREIARVPGALVSAPAELLESAFHDKIVELTANPRGLYTVAVDVASGRVVAHAFLDPMRPAAIAHVVRLTIVVHPGHHRRGIGRALMDHLIAWARANHGIDKIELNVRATNSGAIALYQACGFVIEGRLVGRIRTPAGERIDDLSMALAVGSG